MSYFVTYTEWCALDGPRLWHAVEVPDEVKDATGLDRDDKRYLRDVVLPERSVWFDENTAHRLFTWSTNCYWFEDPIEAMMFKFWVHK